MGNSDITGRRFAMLRVMHQHGVDKWRSKLWLCECDCGGTTVVRARSLTSGHTRSCGCIQREVAGMLNRSHGMSTSRLHKIWTMMKQRCNNPNHDSYKYYGGRGITYSELFETFEGFLANIPDGYSEDLEMDRIDNDGDYAPGNIRWSTRVEQMNNTSRTGKLKHFDSGERTSYSNLSREFGVSAGTISRRVKSGMSLEDACSRPIRNFAGRLNVDDVRKIKADLWSMSRRDVATWHNVDIQVVDGIRTERYYYHIDIDE